jgi:hypothetical protein
LISEYLVHKTPKSKNRLENLSQMANTLGEPSETGAAVVAQLLAKPTTRGVSRNV